MKVMKIIKMVYFIFLLINIALNAQDIFQSIEKGDIKGLKYLLEKDPTIVNIINKDGNTPLHMAILKGHPEIFKYLLTHNPDLEIKNKRGFTPILCASWMFHRDGTIDYKGIIKSLLARGAKVNVVGNDRYNPLHWINHPSENSVQDILELNKLFINMGVDLNEQNIYGSTPLSYAVHIHPEVAKVLIDNGAEVNIKDNQGRTPLFRICGFNHPNAADTVKLLIRKGAMIDTQNNKGQTALERAIANGRKDIAEILISYQNKNNPQDFPVLKGPYLGQKPPGMTPEVFAPGIVSTEGKEMIFGFFRNDSLLFFERIMPDFDKDWMYAPVFRIEMKNGEWTAPCQSKFSGRPWFYSYLDAPVGMEIFFSWRKNLDGSGSSLDIDIWNVVKAPGGWLPPQRLGSPVNTDRFDSWPSVSDDKRLYFFSTREGGYGKADLYCAEPVQGEYRNVENLGGNINSEYNDHDPFISPDGSYLLWCSDRKEGYGGNDLYVAYRQNNGRWSGPFNLGEPINTLANETRPYVTGNGHYLFFVRDLNKNRDVFWVKAQIIAELQPEEGEEKIMEEK